MHNDSSLSAYCINKACNALIGISAMNWLEAAYCIAFRQCNSLLGNSDSLRGSSVMLQYLPLSVVYLSRTMDSLGHQNDNHHRSKQCNTLTGKWKQWRVLIGGSNNALTASSELHKYSAVHCIGWLLDDFSSDRKNVLLEVAPGTVEVGLAVDVQRRHICAEINRVHTLLLGR